MKRREGDVSVDRQRSLRGLPLSNRGFLAGLAILFCVMLLGLAPQAARAQYDFPRIGLSVAPNQYIGAIEVGMDENFVVHVVATGHEVGDPLPFDVAALRWAVYQACCGSDLEILGITYNDQLEHIGDPIGGVLSSSENCFTDDFVHLASVSVTLHAPAPGTYFVAGGPIDFATDCGNEDVIMMDMPIEVTLYEATPNEQSSWSSLKGLYR